VLTILIIFILIFLIGTHLGFYKILEKAGEKGWKAFIPIYGAMTRIKVVGRPSYYIIYFFIPIVNLFCWYYTVYDLLKSFGRTRFIDMVAGALFPYIYLPYLGFSKNEKYLGKASELPKIVKSASREWADAIAFAIIAATLIRWLIMEAYTIPTGSMEKSLLVGDFLFVSKFHYGTRTPATPIQIPLTHQTLPFTKLKSYSDLIQLPQYRLPGITSVKRNDVVVFNVPGKSENEGIDRPIDLKTNYIKRCVAIAGETLEIKAQQVYVNGEISETPELSQTDYYVTVTSILRPRILETYDITDISAPAENGNDFTYQMKLTQKQVDDLTGLNFVKNITKLVADEGQRESRIFPSNKDWNTDWYGPITIPAKGMTIEINEETLYTYGEVIRLYDNNKSVSIEEGKLFIDGNQMEEYTFKQNYYFMMGDNRHDSLDGRFWGFVPEDHIVGKAFFIWLSLEQNKGLFDGKIRWDRFFKMIH